MLTNHDLKYHFHPENGWMNDPNGLVFFQGYYHVFFQHAPHFEKPWKEPMVWGHARTRDFLHWEELPVALEGDQPYDAFGVWSGTATVKDGRLWLFYASVSQSEKQTVSCAYSEDGIHFTKFAGNPIIQGYPADGSRDFRDPAIFCSGGRYYLLVASADVSKQAGNLLLYVAGTNAEADSDQSISCQVGSDQADLTNWTYVGPLYEYPGTRFCECPSMVPYKDGFILATSVMRMDDSHFFEVLYGKFDGRTFSPEIISHFQKGPDEYAGQLFAAPDGRCLLFSWIPGWKYQYEKCIGCLSLPLDLTVSDDKLLAYPAAEVRHLVGENGTVTDAYIEERYVNGGEEVHIRLLEK